MKILLLADPASVHTLKWANALSEKGMEVFLFGLSDFDRSVYNKNIKLETLNSSLKIKSRPDGSLAKVVYLRALSNIKKIIKTYKPDILHSHYASSFGLLGALTKFHPYIISVWGADIYNFPGKSFVHRKIIEYSLSKADKILSTSKFMSHKIREYSEKKIIITPFGIDTDKFRPMKVKSVFNHGLVIGTIKTLEKKYGIEYLIRAFKIVKDKLPQQEIKLLIVGSGSQEKYLKELSINLKIDRDIVFTGFIKSDKVPEYHNMIDIYVAVSIEDSESFGVAILEASACRKPVVVSDIGGLPEVVENGKTGIIVPKENPEELSKVLMKLIMDPESREKYGRNGRQKVLAEYVWEDSVKKMISIYNSFN
jgi:glycosyltransferase involved in cell wall biosynthesis